MQVLKITPSTIRKKIRIFYGQSEKLFQLSMFCIKQVKENVAECKEMPSHKGGEYYE